MDVFSAIYIVSTVVLLTGFMVHHFMFYDTYHPVVHAGDKMNRPGLKRDIESL